MTTRKAARSKRAAPARTAHRKTRTRLTPAQQTLLAGGLVLALALFTLLALLASGEGSVTAWWSGLLRRTFGRGVGMILLVLGALGAWIAARGAGHVWRIPWPRVAGASILYVTTLALVHLGLPEPERAAASGLGGGAVGLLLSRILGAALGPVGGGIVLVALALVGLSLAIHFSLGAALALLLTGVGRAGVWLAAAWRRLGLVALLRKLAARRRRPLPSAPARQKPLPAATGQATRPAGVQVQEPSSPQHMVWALPRVEELLSDSVETEPSVAEIREKTRIIEDTLLSLGVPASVVEVSSGPVVTQFGLEPGYVTRRDKEGNLKQVKVKVSSIAALSNDLALALAASPIRIEAPVPGKGIVGLEVPNPQSSIVSLRGVIESDQFRGLVGGLGIALGRDVSGTPVVDDLSKLPHLLIAGATGSGKSACLNALVACLLLHHTPDQLKLLMIDPKRVELSQFAGIPHLLTPVVVETDRVVGVLGWLAREMDHRYKLFSEAGARNIQAYNALPDRPADKRLPYIVVFIDELAELMMVAADEVERSICRLAQLARATGIHLVIATQRPSVDVVTGLIKANFPARLAFSVTSQIDSRVILDTPGAEKLLGNGDGLYQAPDSPKLQRIQGCWVPETELAQLVAFWKAQLEGQAAVGPAPDRAGSSGSDLLVQQALWDGVTVEEQEAGDPLLEQAIGLVREDGRASVSFLQRKLGIGYTRAARLIDVLETRGVVGPATGSSKAREVLPADAQAPDSDAGDEADASRLAPEVM
ncbi:MAG: FtsK/SpoIIIE family DNA translocase [Anaerolineae bacterium]